MHSLINNNNTRKSGALNTALILFMLLILLVLPQMLVANHSPLTRLQQQQLNHNFSTLKAAPQTNLADMQFKHQVLHLNTTSADFDFELEHSISADHSHESVSLINSDISLLSPILPCYLTDRYSCIKLFSPPPEYPPKV
ncbi:MAG: hypothetical protein V7784_13155 [Oceanospirillaceae bacterium]